MHKAIKVITGYMYNCNGKTCGINTGVNTFPNRNCSLTQEFIPFYLSKIFIINPGGGEGERGALPYKLTWDVPFLRVLFFSLNSSTGCKNL